MVAAIRYMVMGMGLQMALVSSSCYWVKGVCSLCGPMMERALAASVRSAQHAVTSYTANGLTSVSQWLETKSASDRVQQGAWATEQGCAFRLSALPAEFCYSSSAAAPPHSPHSPSAGHVWNDDP